MTSVTRGWVAGLLLALSAAVCWAQSEEDLQWIRDRAIPITTVEAGKGFEDLQPLKKLIGDARIVSLGEATHGSREFFQMKHRILEFLAAEMGFNVFSIEANMPEAYRLNDYVLHGRGDPKQLLAGMYFWTWNTEEVLDMILWMREFNRSGKGTVQFTGFDMQTPTVAAAYVREFIRQADPEGLAEVNRIYMEAQSPPGASGSSFGVASSSFLATSLAGKQVRFSGWIKTADVNRGYAGLWLRIDGSGNRMLFLDNMSTRGARGTSEWGRYEIAVTVPADAVQIVFGMLHPGNGTAWFDSLALEVDGGPMADLLFDLSFESAQPGRIGFGGAPRYSVQLDPTVAYGGRQSLRSRYLGMSAAEVKDATAEWVRRMESSREQYLGTGASEWDVSWATQMARIVAQAAEQSAGGSNRDRDMAANVKWILDHTPNSKIVLWAHNGHVAGAGYRGYTPMGWYLWNEYGTQMVVFGFGFDRGGFQAIEWNVGRLRAFEVSPAPAGSLDAFFAEAGPPIFALDLRQVPAEGPGSWIREWRPARTIGAVYSEQHADAYFSELKVPEAFDFMLFVRETTRARPVQ